MNSDTTVSAQSPWHVERQRPSECLLATLATLSGQPYSYVRAKAHRFLREWYAQETGSIPADCTWRDYAIGHTEAYHAVANQLTRLLGLPSFTFSAATPSGCDSTIPAQGQGYIRFKHSAGSHITPWRDGLIYEVGCDNPMQGMTLSNYLTQHPNAVVLTIETTYPR